MSGGGGPVECGFCVEIEDEHGDLRFYPCYRHRDEAEEHFEALNAAHDAVAEAMFRSSLWFSWLGQNQPLVDHRGRHARHEAAALAIQTLRSLPVAVRMRAMDMEPSNPSLLALGESVMWGERR